MQEIIDIIHECTRPYRKGEVITQENGEVASVTHVYGYPPVEDLLSGWEPVDMVFFVVGVWPSVAAVRRPRLVELLNDPKVWPNPERWALGPSFINIGGIIGDQELALRLMALGKVCGMWELVTPATMKAPEDMWNEVAAAGYIMTVGAPK